MKNILKQSIDRIDINMNILNLLKENGIITISDLCHKSKTDLKNLTLSFEEINKIQVELQLLGLNLKGGL
ncbi:MAG: DNA-directed RNA polymerase subunit alpha C-terminal domain-containing protein [Clostridia bacterium]